MSEDPGLCGKPRRSREAKGIPCRRRKLKGKDACPKHGGRTPFGPANHKYKTGAYSKPLPDGWREAYEQGLADPELGSLKDEQAIARALIDRELRRLQRAAADPEGLEQALGAARTAHRELSEALAGQDIPAAIGALGRAGDAVAEALRATRAVEREERAVHDLRRGLETRRRLAESESRIVERERRYVTLERLAALHYKFAEMMLALFERVIQAAASHAGADPARLRDAALPAYTGFLDELRAASLPN